MERNTTFRSSSPASPTTFVQAADANSFRDLVQKLTGLSNVLSTAKSPPTSKLFPVGPRRPSFKLQERRQTIKKPKIQLEITSDSHRSKVLSKAHRPKFSFPSPVTPFLSDSGFFLTLGTESPSSPAVLEEKAIAEREFYFHPSSVNTPRGKEGPELFTLFPLTSPHMNQD